MEQVYRYSKGGKMKIEIELEQKEINLFSAILIFGVTPICLDGSVETVKDSLEAASFVRILSKTLSEEETKVFIDKLDKLMALIAKE